MLEPPGDKPDSGAMEGANRPSSQIFDFHQNTLAYRTKMKTKMVKRRFYNIGPLISSFQEMTFGLKLESKFSSIKTIFRMFRMISGPDFRSFRETSCPGPNVIKPFTPEIYECS